MLVELAAANAAFAVIKETVQNGGDIMAAGQKLFDFFDNKNAIQKKANSGNDMEAFAALEQIKNNEAELKRMMVYHGRAGLWDDWLKFQKEAKQRREAEEKAAFRKKAARKAKLWMGLMWAAIVSLMGVLALIGVWVLDQLKGRGS
jgi:hypothetical protein